MNTAVCHSESLMIAGVEPPRNQGATPGPRSKTSLGAPTSLPSSRTFDQEPVPQGHTGSSAQRLVPYQDYIQNQRTRTLEMRVSG
jgi:hypothetical protein